MNDRIVQPVEHGVHVRIGHRVVRLLVDREPTVRCPDALVVGVGDEGEEVDRFRRSVLADGEAVAATEGISRLTSATIDAREREPTELERKILGPARGRAWFLNAPGAH